MKSGPGLAVAALAAAVLVAASCAPERGRTARPPVGEAPRGEEEPAAPTVAEAPVAEALVPEAGTATAGADAPAPATSWRACGWGGGGLFWSAAFHPKDPNVIYMGGDVAGIYRTDDKGLNWRFVNKGLGNYAVHSLAVAPSSPDVVYAMTKGGVYRTDNGGNEWRLSGDSGPGKLDISIHRPQTVRALAVDPTDADIVYAGSRHGRLFKSTDGGRTWTRLLYLQTGAGGEAKPVAFSGKGSLVLSYKCPAPDWAKSGRVELVTPEGRALSRWSRMTARLMVPEGGPRVQGQLVVQAGANWLWQAGEFIDAKPGAWTELAIGLEGLKGLEDAKALCVVIRSPFGAYEGPLYLDAVALHAADGATETLADWEDPGNVEGWRAGTRDEKMRFVAGVAQSSGAAAVERGVISSVAVDPHAPATVFATSTAFGVMRSRDSGATWRRLPAPASASSVAVSPHDPRVVMASFWDGKVMRSRDAGETWSAASAGIGEKVGVREVAFDPAREGRVLAIGETGWTGFFCLSTDGGDTWTCERKALDTSRSGNPTLPGDAHSAGMSRLTNITISPSSPDDVFASANWRNCASSDGGLTWEERSKGADITCAHDVWFSGARTYVAAMDEGLLVSDDDGETWRQVAPLRWSADVSGHQWRVRAREVEGADRIVSTVSPWDEKHPNRVLVSADGGATCAVGHEGLPDYIPRVNCMWGRGYARALAMDPSHSDIYYLGIDGDPEPAKGLPGGGVFKSSDGGRTWARLPSQPGSRRMFYGLAVDPKDPRRIFWGACGEGGGVWRTTDAGASWSHVMRDETWVFNVEVSPGGTVYAAARNLWRSRDGGDTWERLTDFSDMQVVGIAVDPADEARIWISRVTWDESSRGGVLASSDGGRTWRDITADLPYRKPLVLRYNPRTRDLWAAGVGIFRIRQ